MRNVDTFPTCPFSAGDEHDEIVFHESFSGLPISRSSSVTGFECAPATVAVGQMQGPSLADFPQQRPDLGDIECADPQLGSDEVRFARRRQSEEVEHHAELIGTEGLVGIQ